MAEFVGKERNSVGAVDRHDGPAAFRLRVEPQFVGHVVAVELDAQVRRGAVRIQARADLVVDALFIDFAAAVVAHEARGQRMAPGTHDVVGQLDLDLDGCAAGQMPRPQVECRSHVRRNRTIEAACRRRPAQDIDRVRPGRVRACGA